MTLYSILDQGPVGRDLGPAQAVRDAVELSRSVDVLGYTRYWVAEHHATAGRAIAAPEVLIGQLAAATTRLRVGSGGIMLPNHAPLHVAEQFRLLEALFPGRIDLGVGRSTGATDERVAAALARGPEDAGGFVDRVRLLLHFGGSRSAPNGTSPLVAMPQDVPLPPLYFLGASESSAVWAARLGLPYAIAAGYRDPDAISRALRAYRTAFVPVRNGDRPHAIVVVRVWAGEDDEHAGALAASERLAIVRQLTGRPEPLRPATEALAYRLTDAERAARDQLDLRSDVVGGPERVRGRLAELVEASGADEVMTVTNTHDPQDRLGSYRRLALALGLATASLI